MKAPVEPGNMKHCWLNGKDLTGWDGDSRLWSVEQGVIRGETTKDKKANGNTFLIWQGGRTKDFDLRISFKVSTQNNSRAFNTVKAHNREGSKQVGSKRLST